MITYLHVFVCACICMFFLSSHSQLDIGYIVPRVRSGLCLSVFVCVKFVCLCMRGWVCVCVCVCVCESMCILVHLAVAINQWCGQEGARGQGGPVPPPPKILLIGIMFMVLCKY